MFVYMCVRVYVKFAVLELVVLWSIIYDVYLVKMFLQL